MKELLKKLRWKWHRDIAELSIGTVLERIDEMTIAISHNSEDDLANFDVSLAIMILIFVGCYNAQ